jgi:hypothetical protein
MFDTDALPQLRAAGTARLELSQLLLEGLVSPIRSTSAGRSLGALCAQWTWTGERDADHETVALSISV